MTADPYGVRVRELFAGLDHAGDLEKPTVRVQIEDQGVRIALAAHCEGDTIECLRFRAWGCPHLPPRRRFAARTRAMLSRSCRHSARGKLCKLCLYRGGNWAVYWYWKMQCDRLGRAFA